MINAETENTLIKWQVKTNDGEYVIIEGHEHTLDGHWRLIFSKNGKIVSCFSSFMYFKEV